MTTIPESITRGIHNPDFILKLETQKNKNSCGTCALRTVLGLNYDYEVSERNLWQYKRRISGEGITPGISPGQIAKIIHRIDKREKIGLKVFMSCNGDLEQLRYFLAHENLPIIHRHFREDKETSGHYEVVLGMDKKDSGLIYLFNPANKTETTGFHKKSIEEFVNFWWPFGQKMERWYLTAIPRDEKLPSQFLGKYM